MRAINARAKKTMNILTELCTHIGDHDKFHTEPFMDVSVEYYDYSNPQFYTIVLTSSEHRQLHGGTLTEENLKQLKIVLSNREYIVESYEIQEEGNLNLRYPISINSELKELDKNVI